MATSKGTTAKTKVTAKGSPKTKGAETADKEVKETKKPAKAAATKGKEPQKAGGEKTASEPKVEKQAKKVTAETKAAAKPAAKPGSKPAAKSAAKPAVKPEPKPAAKPTAKPKPQPVVKPAAKPQPEPEPAALPQPEIEVEVVPNPKVPTKKNPAAKSKDKWHEMRLLLNDMKQETLLDIRRSMKSGAEILSVEETTGDIYDQASSERERELGLLLGDREREKLFSIDEALLRMADGDYGICEECDEDIPMGRLKVMPFTRHCVKCKSELEKIQAQTRRTEEERVYREIPGGGEEEEG